MECGVAPCAHPPVLQLLPAGGREARLPAQDLGQALIQLRPVASRPPAVRGRRSTLRGNPPDAFLHGDGQRRVSASLDAKRGGRDDADQARLDREPVPANDFSARLANGSGPLAPVDGTPLVQPDRKRAQSRPSMKAVLSGEIDTDNELDVPTFIRRHNTHQ